jgi:hypothetical protein
MFFLLDILAQLHTVAIMTVHGIPAICQLVISHGNLFAGNCYTIGR